MSAPFGSLDPHLLAAPAIPLTVLFARRTWQALWTERITIQDTSDSGTETVDENSEYLRYWGLLGMHALATAGCLAGSLYFLAYFLPGRPA